MKLLKLVLLALISLALVVNNSCSPISDDKEVVEYLQNFGYLTEDENLSLNQVEEVDKNLKGDKRFTRALKNLQKNGNIPTTGEYDERTSVLMNTPRCGVSDEMLNKRHSKRYALMSTKWPNTSLTYRFDPMNKGKFAAEEDSIRRIIREAFNVWEKDTVLKFTESNEDVADITISFQHPKHIKIDPHVFNSMAFGHAFQPGKDLGGDIHLNEQTEWDFNVSYDSMPADGKISFFVVILHLIGHSLGLNHTRDTEAVMYEFYRKRTSSLAEDDIRGMHTIYGAPQIRKYTLPAEPQDSEEDRPILGRTLILPDKCNSSYDAIALIDDEVIAFKGRFMFSAKMDMIEIRSRWRHLSPRMTHVDAVYQTTDGRTLFFIGQAFYSFIGTKLEKMLRLSELGFDPSILKIDAIFRRPDSQRTYIFVGSNYYRFDEHKMMLTGYSNQISKAFRDVYGMDTAFTYKGITYFFKSEFYYEFINSNWVLQRMAPDLSGNFFMNCNLEAPQDRVIDFGFDANSHRDYIDIGANFGQFEPDCDNSEIELCGPHNGAKDIKNVTWTLFLITLPRIIS